VTVTNPDGTVDTTRTTRLSRDLRRSKFSALAGIPFADRRGHLWAGLIEGTGGVQAEFGVLPNRLSLSFEAYDFSRELDLDPHLRVTARWFPWHGLYFQAGYDDPLVGDYRSPFVGAGVRWSDDDLKYLLGSVPKF
jgi:phospholipid/cholesterol/gamma-HCH transport system substrate-binding protein